MPDVPAELRVQAAELLLQDVALRRDLDVQMDIGSLAGGSWADLPGLLGRVLPPRRALADFAGVPLDTRAAWLHYPSWLASRLMRTAKGLFDRHQRLEVARLNSVESWLDAVG